MSKRQYRIESREEGRGPKTIHTFSTLKGARDFIKEYWQGPDYIDGHDGFHTDYSTYRLVGFTLQDIGTRCKYHGYCDWNWKTLEEVK